MDWAARSATGRPARDATGPGVSHNPPPQRTRLPALMASTTSWLAVIVGNAGRGENGRRRVRPRYSELTHSHFYPSTRPPIRLPPAGEQLADGDLGEVVSAADDDRGRGRSAGAIAKGARTPAGRSRVGEGSTRKEPGERRTFVVTVDVQVHEGRGPGTAAAASDRLQHHAVESAAAVRSSYPSPMPRHADDEGGEVCPFRQGRLGLRCAPGAPASVESAD
jgi:hypothetical protein